MTRTRYGACPLSVRCGVCPVCGMGGLSSVCRSWADCWSFSPASARLAAPLGLLGCAGAGRRPHPRRNGARLPPPLSAPAVARCGAVAVVAFGGLDRHYAAVLFWGVSDEKELARATLGLGIATLVACVVCLLRWRCLRAEAEMRLWELKAERRRRDMLCARAAAEGGGR